MPANHSSLVTTGRRLPAGDTHKKTNMAILTGRLCDNAPLPAVCCLRPTAS